MIWKLLNALGKTFMVMIVGGTVFYFLERGAYYLGEEAVLLGFGIGVLMAISTAIFYFNEEHKDMLSGSGTDEMG